jgi:hypothetical protein
MGNRRREDHQGRKRDQRVDKLTSVFLGYVLGDLQTQTDIETPFQFDGAGHVDHSKRLFRDEKLAQVDPRAVEANDVLHALTAKCGKPTAGAAANVDDASWIQQLMKNGDDNSR